MIKNKSSNILKKFSNFEPSMNNLVKNGITHNSLGHFSTNSNMSTNTNKNNQYSKSNVNINKNSISKNNHINYTSNDIYNINNSN